VLRIISLLIAFSAINAHANTVYKCQDGENIIFSQIPCETDNNKNEQLDYPKVQNTISSQSTQPESAQNNSNPTFYILSQKKERSLAKIANLKQKYNEEVEKIKANALTAGENRAGASYVQLLNEQIKEVSDKYLNNIEKEEKSLEKIEQKISKLN